MDTNPNLVELLAEMKRRTGSVKRLAERVGVSQRRVQDWLKMDEAKLGKIQPDNLHSILEAARALSIAIQAGTAQRLWDPARSYEENLSTRIVLPAGTRLPLRSLQRTVFGRQVASPFGPSASVITADSERVRCLAQSGNSVLSYKTVRSRSHGAHTHPNLFYCKGEVGPPSLEAVPSTYLVGAEQDHKLAVVNRYGMPSQPPEVWKADFRRAAAYLDESSQILILSVVGTAKRGDRDALLIEDFATVVALAAEAKASVIELNLSCPNCSGPEGRVFERIELTRMICEVAHQAADGIPLIAKIGHMPAPDLERLVSEIAPFASGISAINTVPVRALRQGLDDREPAFGGNPDLLVGLSGQPLLPIGLQTIERLAGIRERGGFRDLVLLGMGGVTTPQDVQNYLDSGADVVQATTVFLFDPLFGEKVHQFLEDRESVLEDPERRLEREARSYWLQAFDRLETDNPRKSQAVAQAAVAVWMDWKKHSSSEGPWSGPKRMTAPDAFEFSRRIALKAGISFPHR
jgi:dihydroorotate dehydrogenase